MSRGPEDGLIDYFTPYILGLAGLAVAWRVFDTRVRPWVSARLDDISVGGLDTAVAAGVSPHDVIVWACVAAPLVALYVMMRQGKEEADG